MSEENPETESPKVHYEHGIPVLPTHADQAKAKEQAEKDAEQAYKDRQIALDGRMVFFTGALFICTLITAGIGAFQACIANKSANAAKSAADTAAKTLEMDRPYLSIDVVPTSDLEFTPEGHGYLRLGSTVVNYGRNAALNAKIWVQFLSQAKGSSKPETDPAAFCENLGNNKSSIESIFGGTYYPQVPYKASWIAEEREAPGSAKVFMPTLIACVAYQSPFSKNWLYTGKMYWIQRARHTKLGGTLVIAIGPAVPQKDLVLAPAGGPDLNDLPRPQ